MKKSIFAIIAVLLLGGFFLAACNQTPLTADQVLQKMAEKSKELKTGQTTMEMTMTAGGESLIMTSEGVFENPEKSYQTVSMLGVTQQVLTLSLTEMYTRASDAEAWVKMDVSGNEQMNDLFDFSKNPEQLVKFYKNATMLTDEKVNGVDCYHISFDLDMVEMLKSANISEEDMGGVSFSGPAKVESWISKADFFNHKMTEKFTMISTGQEINTEVTVTVSGHNQPVEIPTP